MNQARMELVLDGATPEETRRRLCGWLQVTDISDAAVQALLQHDGYATKLGAVRAYPEAVAHMLAHPPDALARIRPTTVPGEAAAASQGAALLRQAGGSMVRWLRAGMHQTDPDTRARRWQACLQCPDLGAPSNAMQSLAGLVADDMKTCTRCGCNVRAKVRLPHENCPAEDPVRSGYSRWGEPLAGH